MHPALTVVFVGFASGVALCSFFKNGMALALLLFLCACSFLAAALVRRSSQTLFVFLAVSLLAAGAGAVRTDIAREHFARDAFSDFAGRAVELSGMVAEPPERTESRAALTLTDARIGDVEGASRVLVFTERTAPFEYGDRVRVDGELRIPTRALETDAGGGRPFNYRAYLQSRGIGYVVFYPDVSLLEHNTGFPLWRALFAAKERFRENVARVLPEPHAALAGGVTLGVKSALGEKLLDAFRQTGLIHIVVLSGYNITLVASALRTATRALPYYVTTAIVLLGIALFVVAVGASATVVRAGLMGALSFVALQTGRTSAAASALLIAGAVMLVANPLLLEASASFQLSFVATLGLIVGTPLLSRALSFIPAAGGLREIAAATIATQVCVLPLLVYLTGEVSVVSLAVNMLVLPTVALAMLATFLTALFGFVYTAVSVPPALIAYALFSYMLAVVGWFAALPFASVSLGAIPGWSVLSVYAAAAALGAFFLYRHRQNA